MHVGIKMNVLEFVTEIATGCKRDYIEVHMVMYKRDLVLCVLPQMQVNYL